MELGLSYCLWDLVIQFDDGREGVEIVIDPLSSEVDSNASHHILARHDALRDSASHPRGQDAEIQLSLQQRQTVLPLYLPQLGQLHDLLLHPADLLITAGAQSEEHHEFIIIN